VSSLPLLAEPDLDWIADVLDVVERSLGQPWRNALERLDDLQRQVQPVAARRFGAVVGAVQRLTGGRARNAKAAREARSLVLGRPVFSPVERRARLVAAAEQLAMTPAALETLLWADLPRERPVELPSGRPAELEVAAFANVALIQRGLRHAQSVKLWIACDAGPILRAAAHRGLLAGASLGSNGETCIEIVGPLALVHRTNVYGRALADLAPLLGEIKRFVLEMLVETSTAMYTTVIASPVLLPSPPPQLGAVHYPLAKLARQLARLRPELAITTHPPLIKCGSSLLCPDLLLQHGGRRCYVEIVAFWTVEHLRRKLAAYRASGSTVILCVETSGSNDGQAELDAAPVLGYARRVDPEPVLERLATLWNATATGAATTTGTTATRNAVGHD
jgi:predicted nuclease of restriction endonuclease-like RecB superfamily